MHSAIMPLYFLLDLHFRAFDGIVLCRFTATFTNPQKLFTYNKKELKKSIIDDYSLCTAEMQLKCIGSDGGGAAVRLSTEWRCDEAAQWRQDDRT